jgi:membrane associated rhomboid family serine protease
MRVPRTQFGAKIAPGSRPVVTLTLIGVCVAVWLAQKASPSFSNALEFWPPAAQSQPWRFLTGAFEHDTSAGLPLHILVNMYALWVLGPYLEQMLGHLRFAVLYLVSAIGGSVGYLVMTSPQIDPASGAAYWTATIGASGAIFGLFGALFVLNHHLGRSSRGLYVLLVINIALGFVPGIAWQAHVGGFLTGIFMAEVIIATSKQNRRKFQLPALAGVLVLLVVAAMAKYAVVDNSVLHSIVSLAL